MEDFDYVNFEDHDDRFVADVAAEVRSRFLPDMNYAESEEKISICRFFAGHPEAATFIADAVFLEGPGETSKLVEVAVKVAVKSAVYETALGVVERPDQLRAVFTALLAPYAECGA